METPAGPAPAAIRAAASRPGVRAAFDRAHRALGDLRFAEGLRRGWEEARAEAAVREAAALAVLGVYGIVTGEQITAWSGLASAITGLATVNTPAGEKQEG